VAHHPDSKRNARSGFCQAGRLPLSDLAGFTAWQ
jgi:hypothetical protein